MNLKIISYKAGPHARAIAFGFYRVGEDGKENMAELKAIYLIADRAKLRAQG